MWWDFAQYCFKLALEDMLSVSCWICRITMHEELLLLNQWTKPLCHSVPNCMNYQDLFIKWFTLKSIHIKDATKIMLKILVEHKHFSVLLNIYCVCHIRSVCTILYVPCQVFTSCCPTFNIVHWWWIKHGPGQPAWHHNHYCLICIMMQRIRELWFVGVLMYVVVVGWIKGFWW